MHRESCYADKKPGPRPPSKAAGDSDTQVFRLGLGMRRIFYAHQMRMKRIKNHLFLPFLSDPGVPGVRSMGPVVFH